MTTAVAASPVRDAWADGLEPSPAISVWEWADETMVLGNLTAAEPGPYESARTPYVREPMECLSATSPIQTVVLMWGTQLGKTETGNAWAGYVIDNSPGPMLYVLPTVQIAQDHSRTRIEPMIEANDPLAEAIGSKWSRDGTNTLLTKKYPGGALYLTGANSAAGLKSRPIRYLYADEVDEYPLNLEEQGDPIALAKKRTDTFGHRRKILITSTPTVKDRSRIEAEYEASDRRQFWVPCVLCGEYQVLVWGQFKWPKGSPEKVRYECEHCGGRFSEIAKREFLPAGEWRARDETRDVAGFHLPRWNAPLGWGPWPEIASEFYENHEDPEDFRVWVNTVAAESFEERGDAPEWQRLFDRREDFAREVVDDDAVFLSVGADVQDDRLEASVWAWGYDKESWLVDHIVMPGDPYNRGTWGPMTELLSRTYEKEDGEALPIAALAVDTGYAQEPVLRWARDQGDRRILPVKGDHWKNWRIVIGSPTKSEVTIDGKPVGLLLWSVGGALVKLETYGFLRQDAPTEEGERYPPGFVHLGRWVDAEFVKQLVAEDLHHTTDAKGFPVREWRAHRHRNEALDCRVYARAAAEWAGLSRMKRPGEKTSKPKRKTSEKKDKKSGGWMDRGSRGRGRGRGKGGGWMDR